MPALPPSFNNARVVAVDKEVAARVRESGERVYEQFETNGFRPTDVSFAIGCLPPRYEPPGPPVVANDDGNPDS